MADFAVVPHQRATRRGAFVRWFRTDQSGALSLSFCSACSFSLVPSLLSPGHKAGLGLVQFSIKSGGYAMQPHVNLERMNAARANTPTGGVVSVLRFHAFSLLQRGRLANSPPWGWWLTCGFASTRWSPSPVGAKSMTEGWGALGQRQDHIDCIGVRELQRHRYFGDAASREVCAWS